MWGLIRQFVLHFVDSKSHILCNIAIHGTIELFLTFIGYFIICILRNILRILPSTQHRCWQLPYFFCRISLPNNRIVDMRQGLRSFAARSDLLSKKIGRICLFIVAKGTQSNFVIVKFDRWFFALGKCYLFAGD